MIKFFRNIRKKLLQQGKTSNYLKYAIGEIVLVVVGILIALQINNWNEYRKDRIIERKLLIELNENLESNATRLKSDMQKELTSISIIEFVLNHLDNRRPYHDSLDVYFNKALFSPDIVLSTSGFESIKLKGFQVVSKDTLRKSIRDLFEVRYDNMLSETVRLEDQFWPSSVLPLKHKHFRISEGRSKPVDYKKLLDDESFKNMISDRMHFRKLAYKHKSESLIQTEFLMRQIEIELKEKNNHMN